ncbi:MAG: hypothetical protein H0T85_06610 [Geodermatophilaceae bacterium]|nr:hypothetical protein [Geodermatophilaceae bacterium]
MTAEALPSAEAARWTAEALPSGRRIALVGTPRDLDALTPLRAAYAGAGIEEAVLALRPGRELADVPPTALRQVAEDVDAVLLVYPRRFAPRTVADGPTLQTRRGRHVPLGLVPAGAGTLETFAVAAAGVHTRSAAHGVLSVALLAQRSRRYADLAGRIRRSLHDGIDNSAHTAVSAVFWWPAEAMVRDDLITGLGHGVGLAVYLGHGRPKGWVGYGGVQAHHLAGGEPVAMVVSLACHTLSRRHTGLAFAEALVTTGSASASLGATTSTPHVANARWSLRLVDALATGPRTSGDLIVAAAPEGSLSVRYRLIGDPLAPLLDAPGAREAARALTDDVTLTPTPQEEAA